jgi:NADH:ubiquinone oxidoreductase subunit F (NADH-binding)
MYLTHILTCSTSFYHGCSTFLPVFDPHVDTFEALHHRSPFCVNAICHVASKVRDGGGQQSELSKKLQEETQKIASATLFAPVTRQEAVQATSMCHSIEPTRILDKLNSHEPYNS